MFNLPVPNSFEAEIAVVGAIIKTPEILIEISSIIKEEDFYNSTTKTIFQALLEMHDKEIPITSVSIIDYLIGKNLLDKAGGDANIIAYINSVKTSANAIYHAQLIKEKSKKRNLQLIFANLLQESANGDFETEDLLNKAENLIYQYATQQDTSTFSSIKNVLVETMYEIDKMLKDENENRITTGFSDLDKQIYGFMPSDFIIIAARPAMGKTAFALNIMAEVAIRQKKSVAFFSLEMSKKQLGLRLLCSEAGVESKKIKEKTLSDDEFNRFLMCGELMAKSKINIDDTASISVMGIASKARKLKEEVGLDLIMIDYLQLMQGNKKYNHGDNRQQEISDISRSLKLLARELDVPIIALSQLNRGVEQRNNKKPLLSDLRESGSLEQDTDMVMFLYRDDYYDKESEQKNICTVITAKNRNGEIGETDLYFNASTTTFTNLARETA